MENQRPIIGILCIDVAAKLFELYGSTVKSYIAASYIKFVEGAGARALPIWIGKDEHYYIDIMGHINGILIPGGAVFFDSAHIQKPEQANECVQSAAKIYRIACQMNEEGNYFPVWGICLGYELLLYHSAGGKELRQDCRRLNKSMALELERDFKSSKMFRDLSADMEDMLRKESFAFHYHQYCITKDDLRDFKIADQWRVTSVNRDDECLEFISTIEHLKYPFYGVQFHPEKVIFEWTLGDNISHTSNSIKCAQYFANFFISECRKNRNCFVTEEEANRHIICNFPITFTGIRDIKWQQCYLFDETSDYPE